MFRSLCTLPSLHSAWKHVKSKNSAGGIDGFSVSDFEADLEDNLNQLLNELKSGTWNPEPYLRIEIPKNETEKRKLGLLSVKDKIVQQGIKNLIEPRLESLFLSNSYGYRPEKGHTKAVRRTIVEFQQMKTGWVAKLDIDNYFDTINHALLFSRLQHVVKDSEIMRLIELSTKMGVVSKQLKWTEVSEGVPQGAVLSPLLANFYLHSFDQFVTTKTKAYIRYADDFLILAESKELISKIVTGASEFLQKRLLLKLNEPIICETQAGVPFLGVIVRINRIDISESKRIKLMDRIQSLELKNGYFTEKGLEALQGIKNYYARLLPEKQLLPLDESVNKKLLELIDHNWKQIPNVKRLQENWKLIPRFSQEAELAKNRFIKECTEHYSAKKRENNKPIVDSKKENKTAESKNKLLINQKKREYQKREGEGAELVITTYGSFIGKNNKGITVKINGKNLKQNPSNALEHVTVTTRGVSISSDAIYFCTSNKIPVDFFDGSGKLYASILSPVLVEELLWQKQASLSTDKKAYLASKIVEGKLKNQFNLIKYYHKYHKEEDPNLSARYDAVEAKLEELIKKVKSKDNINEKYAETLMSYEAAGATAYWAYVRQLIEDDGVDFESRERKGATDLFNSLLNYGYALLYARVWQAILSAKLNPALSVLHVPQPGKPTLAFDLMELFRTQAVDRIVISLVQKREPLKMDKTLLEENTKKLLIQNVFERLNRYEKYRGEEMKFLRILRKQTGEWTDYISGKSKSFKPYIAKW